MYLLSIIYSLLSKSNVSFRISFQIKREYGRSWIQQEIYNVKNSILIEKTLYFSARIIKLHKYLTKQKQESVISKQIIRSATSIGANANEAIYGLSRADFISKLHISLKETAETEYWLRLLILSDYLTKSEGESLLQDCLAIKKILIATLNTTKENQLQQTNSEPF